MESFGTILPYTLSLFLLMDPIGNVPLFISILKDYSPAKQRIIIIREMCIALGIILFFHFLGDAFLDLLGVTQYTTMISGGIILFLIALKMLFPSRRDPEVELAHKKEPFIVPLAIPLVAGPAVLTAVMLYAHEQSHKATLVAIFIAWAASMVILLASSFLKRILGWRGISACEKLMGLLLTLLAVQMFLEGLKLYNQP
ncbi:MAG: MarC family protein [Chlamydiales bacterium]